MSKPKAGTEIDIEDIDDDVYQHRLDEAELKLNLPAKLGDSNNRRKNLAEKRRTKRALKHAEHAAESYQRFLVDFTINVIEELYRQKSNDGTPAHVSYLYDNQYYINNKKKLNKIDWRLTLNYTEATAMRKIVVPFLLQDMKVIGKFFSLRITWF